VLFIASGAFHLSKPSDMLPELQGRLPIRVELKALTEEDFVRILSETRANLVEQYTALLGTEKVTLNFTPEAVREIARIACQVNEAIENIGARRLQTVMERLLEELSFEAEDREGESVTIDQAYVQDKLAGLAKDTDLSKYIL
jgi:ATP-dependent HslUV protease ATP-binding subunit HslU